MEKHTGFVIEENRINGITRYEVYSTYTRGWWVFSVSGRDCLGFFKTTSEAEDCVRLKKTDGIYSRRWFDKYGQEDNSW